MAIEKKSMMVRPVRPPTSPPMSIMMTAMRTMSITVLILFMFMIIPPRIYLIYLVYASAFVLPFAAAVDGVADEQDGGDEEDFEFE